MRGYRLHNGKTVVPPRSYMPLICVLLFFFLYISVNVTGFNAAVICRRAYQFFFILGQMFPPDMSYLPAIWKPLFDTIKMSLLGSVIGSVAAVPFAVMASTNIIKQRLIVSLSRLILSILRTLPTLVTALIATYAFGLGTLAGTAAIAVFTFSYIGKVLYELIETAEMGAFEAMESMGADRPRAFIGAVVPQILPAYFSNCLFCFEGNVRYASILGYVGAGGLGLILNEKIGWRQYPAVGMILIMLFAAVIVIEGISHYIRSKLA
ncbi:phosphonate transport system permease protein [Anaerobacterium chartisolvens]|uniref:Phosphonate transport system permease protein n=1 Tax=Anaerobacterium chartisolvens TaxID=1297424 RepID=A0A369AV38_9FIRM|nr:phosphonate ABC transporter, permease protein PhnE [Anaerobacterium chartisolvens]RCX12198.1 phosphonate transport system permease protein [Anaerobacterium chartisolvens]